MRETQTKAPSAARVLLAALIIVVGLVPVAALVGAAGVGASLVLSASDYAAPMWQRYIFSGLLLIESVLGIKALLEWFSSKTQPQVERFFPGDVNRYFGRALQLLLAVVAVLATTEALVTNDGRVRKEAAAVAVLLIIGVVLEERKLRTGASAPAG